MSFYAAGHLSNCIPEQLKTLNKNQYDPVIIVRGSNIYTPYIPELRPQYYNYEYSSISGDDKNFTI